MDQSGKFNILKICLSSMQLEHKGPVLGYHTVETTRIKKTVL